MRGIKSVVRLLAIVPGGLAPGWEQAWVQRVISGEIARAAFSLQRPATNLRGCGGSKNEIQAACSAVAWRDAGSVRHWMFCRERPDG